MDTDLTVGNILAFAQLAVGMDIENNLTFSPMPCYGVSYGVYQLSDGLPLHHNVEIRVDTGELAYLHPQSGHAVVHPFLVRQAPLPEKQ